MGKTVWTQDKSLLAAIMKLEGKDWKEIAKVIGVDYNTVCSFMRLDPSNMTKKQEKKLYRRENLKQCLQCDFWFFSHGKYNRRCPRCRSLGEAATSLKMTHKDFGWEE